jgi:hypothetical protein
MNEYWKYKKDHYHDEFRQKIVQWRVDEKWCASTIYFMKKVQPRAQAQQIQNQSHINFATFVEILFILVPKHNHIYKYWHAVYKIIWVGYIIRPPKPGKLKCRSCRNDYDGFKDYVDCFQEIYSASSLLNKYK